MTFDEWWHETYSFDGFPAPDGERKDIAKMGWDAAQKDAIRLLSWLHEEMKAGADDYEGSDEVERFLNNNDI